MFTGIIEGLGEIRGLERSGGGLKIRLIPPFSAQELTLGESVAVNGVCLTVTHIDGQTATFDISPETISRTTLGGLKPGDRVNVERALRASDRLGGHIVSGHVDGVGRVLSRRSQGDFLFYEVQIPSELSRYVIQKGSIAIDGISLTVNDIRDHRLSLAIIPHTASLTTIGYRQPGDLVNIEVDIIGKYIEKLLSPWKNSTAIDQEFLKQHGFFD
ncbi:riboflavin synthase [Thermosulfuriphilus ammonigenes]|uniref:Riboflavin synthase n=1 Tax=Thermosulfuriphilus ammonigenes TaxID=1936021 RepID=A0A6G7PTV6_9BACT|nr:riboflavin synthase [Thermosulfuriphilus ammonigenes]MBA2848934.1 riboflavin synthase [Thermosulfuriphilus ammonigenes]QIJ70951.1 riboflavin synthase [Thermosulfuriphilus ammonigenes]HFB83203.1 riboflavin synthase [Thermodesulfatator sp.]